MEQQQNGWQEAKEKIGETIRWTEQPKDDNDNSVYLGTEIVGLFIGTKTGIGQNNSSIHEIELAGGRLISIWGSIVLDGKMEEVTVGHEICIRYLGYAKAKKSGGADYKDFTVFSRVADFKEAVAPAAAVTPGPAPVAAVTPAPAVAPTADATPAPAAAPDAASKPAPAA